jgi:hypothetical protein
MPRGVFDPRIFQNNVFQISIWYSPLPHDLSTAVAVRPGAQGFIVVRDAATGVLSMRPHPYSASVEVRPDDVGVGLIEVRDKASGEVVVL